MRVILALVLFAVVLVSPASAEVKWLCSAAKKSDPCDVPQDTVQLQAFRAERGWSSAERVPSRRTDRRVDCFYVYPTVSEQPGTTAERIAEPAVRSIALYQAARFAPQCRIFAPLYRQVTLKGIFGTGLAGDARDIAYADVREAWRTYLRRQNRGRGVVLIGHSQGTGVLRRLIAGEIDHRPAVRRRLVSALLLGGNVSVRAGGVRGGDFDRVPLCSRGGQTGCVIAYSIFLDDPPENAVFGPARTASVLTGEPVKEDTEIACVNPGSIAGNEVTEFTTINPSERFGGPTIRAGIEALWGGPLPTAGTTWLQPADRYEGRCERINGAHVLKLRPVDGARRLNATPNPGWGLHLVDVNGALGELETAVARQIRAYTRDGRG